MPSIDIINATSKFQKRLSAGESYDDIWTCLTCLYDMTAKEMGELEELLKGEKKMSKPCLFITIVFVKSATNTCIESRRKEKK